VTDERDRQRVLIQITQNLATRIRNSHAFNLPTFYLPHEDDGGLPCSIPNAIEDVCEEIDKVCADSGCWWGGVAAGLLQYLYNCLYVWCGMSASAVLCARGPGDLLSVLCWCL
jgi:hypothetical protein